MASSLRVHLVAFLVMTLFAGSHILSKAVFNRGFNTFVFTFYVTAMGNLLLIPIALVLERKQMPPMSFKVSFKIFLLAFLGTTAPCNLFGLGMKLCNSTPISALFNLIPVITFILALLYGMERVTLKRVYGIVKVTGVILCFAGVIVLASYDGPVLKPINHHYFNLYHTKLGHDHGTSSQSKIKWALGVFLMSLATICWSSWQIMQGLLLKEYPSVWLNATFQSIFSTFQTFIVALGFERNFSRWKLGFDMVLLAAVYMGILVAVVAQYLQIWVIEERGPVFLSMNQPIALVITFAISWTFLGEIVHLGSIFGAVLMVAGLYSVLWGKGREQKANEQGNLAIKETVPELYDPTLSPNKNPV